MPIKYLGRICIAINLLTTKHEKQLREIMVEVVFHLVCFLRDVLLPRASAIFQKKVGARFNILCPES